MKGKLIVIDGADGSGKATQAKLLLKRLKKEGYKASLIDFPRYGKPSAYFVEQYLNGKYGTADQVQPKLASLFYALDRFEAKNDLEKQLDKGIIMVSNRYVSANAGHQGGKIQNKKQREEFLTWLENLEYDVLGLPKPDINIYLDVPWQIGQKLVDKKGHRDYVGGKKRDIHEKDRNHLKNTQECFNYLSKTRPNWMKITCIKNNSLLKIEEINKILWDKIQKVLK